MGFRTSVTPIATGMACQMLAKLTATPMEPQTNVKTSLTVTRMAPPMFVSQEKIAMATIFPIAVNSRGTIAMARTMDPHSATAQFFINVTDNDFLNFRSETPDGFGYCVFGRVFDGLEVVDAIKAVETTHRAGHSDVPRDDVIINQASIV